MAKAQRDPTEETWAATVRAAGPSLSEVARRAGMNKGLLSRIVNGKSTAMPHEARALLRVLDEQRAADDDS